MRRIPIEDPEEGGTLGPRASLAEALASEQDYSGQAAIIQQRLQACGLAEGASLLAVCCGTGALLAALRERYTVSGCDPYDARLALARRRLSGVPLWQSTADGVSTEWPVDAVLLCELDHLSSERLIAALTAARDLLSPGGCIIALPGATPTDLPAGTALMDLHDGEGLKIVRSAVVRRTGSRALLDQHWMIARDQQGVETFIERHTIFIHSADDIAQAMDRCGFSAAHHTAAALPHGLWVGVRYSPAHTGS